MLIPSIDLMGGKIVQLVQGERKALEFEDFDEWIARFSSYPLVQLIDLDAAMGNGNNRDLVREFAGRLPCQVGGGIRSLQAAEEMLATGARRVILGSCLIRDGRPDAAFAEQVARTTGPDRLVFAIDSKGGRVAIRGWRELTPTTPLEMITALETWCTAFLYTHIDTEGLMKGIPLDVVRPLRNATKKQLIAAGGIATNEQIDELDALQIDAVVGMAIYTGKIKLCKASCAAQPGVVGAGDLPH
ncbi:MAG: 1-(5-phosphoribosyl)-5-[(5-phosphoribosylamino)methylideneamino] imidazole-4-carboxamide isomerase [Acidobacteriia bacterium]|nr:1-(5-phosphoribosyl)-5-[(5-phosphoribosylamino)methylideneamino] imidazole-4-carboxamide isomerase [Terriglobia bacterium]